VGAVCYGNGRPGNGCPAWHLQRCGPRAAALRGKGNCPPLSRAVVARRNTLVKILNILLWCLGLNSKAKAIAFVFTISLSLVLRNEIVILIARSTMNEFWIRFWIYFVGYVIYVAGAHANEYIFGQKKWRKPLWEGKAAEDQSDEFQTPVSLSILMKHGVHRRTPAPGPAHPACYQCDLPAAGGTDSHTSGCHNYGV